MATRRRRSLPRQQGRLEPGVPVSRLEWSRREREPQRAPAGGRALAAVAIVLELIVLVWLLSGTPFALRSIDVSGVHHLSAAQVRLATGLTGHPSVIGLDADTIRRKLQELPWVRTAAVTPVLPDRLDITVQEWRAVAVYHAAGGDYLLNDEGTVLERVPPIAGPLEIDGPDKTSPAAGHRVLDPQLLQALLSLDGAFPQATGWGVTRFALDSCENLTLVAQPGFTVLFGRMLTQEQIQSLQAKVDALASLRGTVDYGSRDLDYVNVENPSAPAVHLHSAKPGPSPSPAPGASPSPPGIRVVPCQ